MAESGTPSDLAASPSTGPRIAPRWMGASVVLVAVAVFLPTLLYGYILDDTTIIRGNAIVQSWHGLLSAWTHPFWIEAGGATRSGLYRPLLIAIFTLIWNAGHRFAIWFHLFAIAAHAMASWLVWRLARRAVNAWVAFGAALWFAAHPVHVEAIASVANVSEVLVAIFALWLTALVRDAGDRCAGGGEVGWRAALAMAAVYAAAMLTKESGFVIPAMAALAAWGWRTPAAPGVPPTSARGVGSAWRRPLILGGVVLVAVLLVRTLVAGGAIGTAAMAAPGLEGLSAWQRAWAMLALGPRVLALLFWPGVQLPHYGPEALVATAPSIGGVTTLLLLGGTLALGVALARRGDRRLLAAAGWLAVTFLPASNLLVATGQILAERTLYGATIGAALLAAWVVARALDAAGGRSRVAAAGARLVAVAVVGFAAFRGGAHTVNYAAAWRTHDDLFHYLVANDPAGYRGHWLLALEVERTHPDSALHEFGRAFANFHGDRQLTIDYANALLTAGRPDNAAEVAANLMDFADMRADSNAVGLYLTAVDRAYGADSARALARVLASGLRRLPP